MAKDFPCRIHLPESFPDSIIPYIDVLYFSSPRPGASLIKLKRSSERVRVGTEEPGETRLVELHLAGTLIFRGTLKTFMPSTDFYIEDLLPEIKPAIPPADTLKVWKLSVPDSLASRGVVDVYYGDTRVCVDCDEDEFVICDSQIKSLSVNGVDLGQPGGEVTSLPISEKDFSEEPSAFAYSSDTDSGSSTDIERPSAPPPPGTHGETSRAMSVSTDSPAALAALEQYESKLLSRIQEQDRSQELVRKTLEAESATRQREQLELQAQMLDQMTEQERVRYESDLQLYNQQEALRAQLIAQNELLESQRRDLESQRSHVAALIEQQKIRDEIVESTRQQAELLARQKAEESQLALLQADQAPAIVHQEINDPYAGKIYGNVNPRLVEMLGLSVYDLYEGNEIITQDGKKWVVTLDKFRNTKLVEYKPAAGLPGGDGFGYLKGIALAAVGFGAIYAARPSKDASKEKKK